MGLVSISYRTRLSVHSSTGYSLYFLTHGREPRLPLAIMLGTSQQGQESNRNFSQFSEELKQRLATAKEFASLLQDVAKNQQKEMCDRRNRTVAFKPGDYVMINDPVNSRRKLEPNWKGPFLVLQDDGSQFPITYLVDDVNRTSSPKAVHVNRLKPYRSKYICTTTF